MRGHPVSALVGAALVVVSLPIVLGALLIGAALLAGCASADVPVAAEHEVATSLNDVRRVLAPAGDLRIAVYPGSPTSLVRRGGYEVRGVSVEIGRELASRLGVAARLVEFERIEQVVEAVHSGQADMTITNPTPARAALVDFTEPLIALELGFLAMPGSPVDVIADVDRAGARVGVSEGSSSQAALGALLQSATLVPAASLKAAADLLKERRIDVFAANKAMLYQLADGLPGARVLDGRWGTESLAIAVPKGRDSGRPWLAQFAFEVRADGLVRRAAERAGLRGLADPEGR